MLDQSIRVLQAYIDITAEQGCLSTTLMLLKTMVCVKQAIWNDSSPIAILPGVAIKLAQSYAGSLQDLSALRPQELKKIARRLGVNESKMQSFLKVASAMPSLQIKFQQQIVDKISVEIKRLGSTYGPEHKAYTPLFPKSQTEGWFVLLCDVANDEILALKRASFNERSQSTTTIIVPEECHGMEVTLMIVSDVYPDVRYEQKLGLLSKSDMVSTDNEKTVVSSMSVDAGANKSTYIAGPQTE